MGGQAVTRLGRVGGNRGGGGIRVRAVSPSTVILKGQIESSSTQIPTDNRQPSNSQRNNQHMIF